MSNLSITKDLVQDFINSGDRFPVNFDDAWQWLGYSTKQAAKKKLSRNFDVNVDYSSKWMSVAHSNGLTASRAEVICLTVECFKELGMLAQTEQGKLVRKYYLECERIVKEFIPQTQQPMRSLPSAVDYIEAQDKLNKMPRSNITILLQRRMLDELALLENNQQAQLAGACAPIKHYTTATVRAAQLGYSAKQIDNGAALGKFVKAAIAPDHKDWQGQYEVWHYEVNEEFDSRIHAFFLTRAL